MKSNMHPIAVVGMACRFPKGLEDLKSLWQALQSRFSAIDTVPADRWTADRYHSSNPIAKGKAYIRRGGFLTHPIDKFDPSFFGISPRDAENMDPQQRILLEVVWEAFENAGIDLPAQAGRAVGVYVGGFMLDHMISQMSAPNRSAINQHTAAGMMMTMLSNRISHTFDLRGPSLSIDTACSSSLVAFHYACQDLWRGATTMAIVGGSNCMLRPEYPMGMCKGHFLSKDGECKSFDERADGYGRGEGAGAVLLKPLADAIADGDPILATVIGTGSNQDGHTPGISMPSGDAQRMLIEQVCDQYEIDPATVRYVECHGTGTAIGDPTESKAIGETYGKARPAGKPVIVGSIKSNIGHLEAAAGVAGVIKTVLTLMHKQATPIANLQKMNPAIEQERLNVRVANELITLGDQDETIRCAINSFGYGGSNAHAILESVPTSMHHGSLPEKHSSVQHDSEAEMPVFLPLSARSDNALVAMAERFHQALQNASDDSLNDFVSTACHRRSHLSHRAVVIGQTREHLMTSLEALSKKESISSVVRGTQPYSGNRKPVFVFTGMGPQWWAMGQELYQSNRLYRKAVTQADAVFASISGFSVLEQMLKSESESQITKTEYAQPANFLIQIGITECLLAAGVEPGAMVGHSVGELASAYFSGVLSLHDAMTVCYHRSQMQATCIGMGAMMAVGLSKENTLQRLSKFNGRISVAAANGPTNVTVAGDSDLIADLASELAAENIFHKKLEVEVPYHSPMMDPIMAPLAQALSNVRTNLPTVPLYSTVTGALVTEPSYGADYWPLNVRQSVEFESAIQALLAAGYQTFLEIGPHPVLATSIKDCSKVAGQEIRQLYTLRRNQPELLNLHQAIAGVFANGCDLNWNKHVLRGAMVSLPNYAWQRERFWMENDRAMQDRIATITLPMLGIQEAPATPAWRNDFDHEPMLYLRDHVVAGVPILPAAGYIETMMELAVSQLESCQSWAIRNLEILAPMMITAERGLDCVTSFDPHTKNVTIRGLDSGRLGAGQVHARGTIVGHSSTATPRIERDVWTRSGTNAKDVTSFYGDLAKIGLQYGPAFQTIREIKVSECGNRVLSHIQIKENLEHQLESYHVHPTVLDACFQSLMAMLTDSEVTYLPTRFREIVLHQKVLPKSIWCIGEKVFQNHRFIDCDLTLVDEEGNVVASLHGMRSVAASSRERVDRFGDRVKRQILGYDWSYASELSEPKRLGHWMIVGDVNGLQNEIAERLEHFGARVVARVEYGSEFFANGMDYQVREGSRQDMAQVLAQCGDLDGIAFLGGLQAVSDSNDPTAERAIANLVSAVQATIDTGSAVTPRLYVLTQAAFAVDPSDGLVEPGQTALNGFTRVAYNELDGLMATSIDLPRNLSEDVLHTLALELVCDDNHDEVALRGQMRLVSELKESPVLTEERIEYEYLSDDNPVLIRAVDEATESIGTAKLVAANMREMGPEDVFVRVEATVLPTELLMGDTFDPSEKERVEFVGEVVRVGQEVSGLIPGMRVAGFAPLDIASHLHGSQRDFRVVPVGREVDASSLVSCLKLHVRAAFASNAIEVSDGDHALIENSPLGLLIAQRLASRGVKVSMLVGGDDSSDMADLEAYSTYTNSPEGIQQAYVERTVRQGFNVLVAGLKNWTERFDFRILNSGAQVVDMDVNAMPIALDASIQSVVRSDIESITSLRKKTNVALESVVRDFESGAIQAGRFLDVSLADLAWQKLPLVDVTGTLVLNTNTRGKDLPIVQRHTMSFRDDATYLITGGFGGLGLKTAEWLVENGARHLVLTGRKGADTEEKQSAVDSLVRAGCEVRVVACDTADVAGVRAMVASIEKEMPPLKGVFHSGAVILDQPIAEIDAKTLQLVMQSKATGAWNLHEATQHLSLDHFVMYSSVANLVGNSRQSIYSAANGFLNGLAHHRRRLGMPALSVNWGAIADVGVVARDEKLEQFLRYTGLRGIASREGLGLLKDGLARNVTQFGVTIITSWADWARFETRGCKSPRFETLIANDSESKDNSMRDALMEELSQLDPADQVELLATLIADVIAGVLKLDVASVPLDRAINQMGVDSLMATEIQLLLDSKLGLNISVLELIGEATIRAIASQARKTLCPENAMVSV